MRRILLCLNDLCDIRQLADRAEESLDHTAERPLCRWCCNAIQSRRLLMLSENAAILQASNNRRAPCSQGLPGGALQDEVVDIRGKSQGARYLT